MLVMVEVEEMVMVPVLFCGPAELCCAAADDDWYAGADDCWAAAEELAGRVRVRVWVTNLVEVDLKV